eukprot:7556598-Pyramimonas_sp.AAC.2
MGVRQRPLPRPLPLSSPPGVKRVAAAGGGQGGCKGGLAMTMAQIKSVRGGVQRHSHQQVER